MLMEGVSIQISCSKHVAHFLKQEYGGVPHFNHSTSIGASFLGHLNRGFTKYDHRSAKHENLLTVTISFDDFKLYGGNITLTNAALFNKAVEDRLKEKFDAHMHALVHIAGFKKAAAIREFYDSYGFDDEIWPFESLRKHFRRNPHSPTSLKTA